MRRFPVFLAALLLSACAAGPKPLALSEFKPAPLAFTPPKVQEAQLSGGAKVFLLEDHDVPLVRVYFAFRGGSVYDPPEKAGLAQATGLAWRTGGTSTLSPEAFDERLDRKGMEVSLSLGRELGWASLSALSRDLPDGLSALSELVLTPALRQERVDWAVKQVADGLRRENDDPESLAYRELRRVLYEGHPRGLVATPETVGRVTRDDVVALQRRLIEDGTWTIGVVGDFRSQEVLERLEQQFGKLRGDGKAFGLLPPPPEPKSRFVLVPKALPQSTIVWARFGPARTSPDSYALDLADHLVGSGGFQCRLSREIRSNRGLAYSVGGFYEPMRGFGVLGAYASTKKESTREVMGLLRNLIADAAQGGFCLEEVNGAKEALSNRYVFRYQDPAALVKEQMSLTLQQLPLDLPAQFLPRIQAQTPESVSQAARTYYGPGPTVVVVVGDVDPADPAWKGEDNVSVVRLP